MNCIRAPQVWARFASRLENLLSRVFFNARRRIFFNARRRTEHPFLRAIACVCIRRFVSCWHCRTLVWSTLAAIAGGVYHHGIILFVLPGCCVVAWILQAIELIALLHSAAAAKYYF